MSDYEYFELKYLEEVNDLFLSFKKKSELYNLGLFQKNNNFMDLFDLIYDSIDIIDESESDEEEFVNEEEINL